MAKLLQLVGRFGEGCTRLAFGRVGTQKAHRTEGKSQQKELVRNRKENEKLGYSLGWL